ncbi:MAG: hypothetical protein ABSC13_07620 [Dehalococcoidia bacterium]|jgi:hypothetical protein
MAGVFFVPIGVGVAIGLTRIISGRATLMGGGLLAIAYVVLVAILFFSMGVAACPHCSADPFSTRLNSFETLAVLVGILLVLALVGVAGGAFIAGPFARWRRNRSQPQQP